MHITEVNEVLEKVSKGELTTEDAQKLLGTYKDEELGKELRNVPGKEQLEIFAIILVLILLELMYDSLFIYGILENWDQQFLSFTIAMAFLVLGLISIEDHSCQMFWKPKREGGKLSPNWRDNYGYYT